jgi:hypothetical protein
LDDGHRLRPWPCERLLASSCVTELTKAKLKVQFEGLDPVRLLRDIRAAQQVLSDIAASGPRDQISTPAPSDVSTFLDSLATAWKHGEIRPTHRKQPSAVRWWRTRADPFLEAWPVVEGWLVLHPSAAAKELMERLAKIVPDVYASKAQLRTLQRRVKAWRAERAKELILGQLRKVTPQPEPPLGYEKRLLPTTT